MQALYATLDKRITMVRRYRHDLAKHIHTLEQLLEPQGSNGSDMAEIVAEMKQQYTLLSANPICSDEIIDALLTVKTEECKQKEIALQLNVSDCIFRMLPGIDMVSLVYNLLENAIEACEPLPKGQRYIHVSLEETGNSLDIRLENSFSPEQFSDFRTTKHNPEGHGLGMEILSDIVTRHHGRWELQLNRKAGILSQQLHFPGEERGRNT